MNFIVEENAIYYMDENQEKNAEVTFRNWMGIPWRLIIPLFLPLPRNRYGRKPVQAAAEEISRQEKASYLLVCKGWFARHKEFQRIIQE